MGSFIEVSHDTLAAIVDNYMAMAKEKTAKEYEAQVARKVEALTAYQNSFWQKLVFKKPGPMKDLEAEARSAWRHQYQVYYAKRLAFVEKYRLIVEHSDTVERVFISAQDYQWLNECPVITDYKITGDWWSFMENEDWI